MLQSLRIPVNSQNNSFLARIGACRPPRQLMWLRASFFQRTLFVLVWSGVGATSTAGPQVGTRIEFAGKTSGALTVRATAGRDRFKKLRVKEVKLGSDRNLREHLRIKYVEGRIDYTTPGSVRFLWPRSGDSVSLEFSEHPWGKKFDRTDLDVSFTPHGFEVALDELGGTRGVLLSGRLRRGEWRLGLELNSILDAEVGEPRLHQEVEREMAEWRDSGMIDADELSIVSRLPRTRADTERGDVSGRLRMVWKPLRGIRLEVDERVLLLSVPLQHARKLESIAGAVEFVPEL
jgi:hypothetical protein